jgi:homoserine dehydrogenase
MSEPQRNPPGGARGAARRDGRAARADGAPVLIGLCGAGTVGGGVLSLLHDNARWLAERVGVPVEVKRVLVRDLDKERVAACDRALLTTDPRAVLDDPSIEVVVEVMGGDTLAGELVEQALARGKSVVTANKMLLASRGPALVDLAVEKGVDLAFEGAVGGGIPIIRTLRDAFASDWVQGLTAIIIGTCNYCLTRMQGDGLTMEAAIAEAQAKGYAEAEPSLDVDGHDAAHKLVVLAMLAFGARVDGASVSVEGIRAIDEHDHAFARRFGYVIKHLAIGKDHGDEIELRVHPALVPRSHVLANVSGVLNAVLLEGRALGPCLVYGRGAGDLPTAVSVVADILDVARSLVAGVSGLQTRGVVASPRPVRAMADVESRYYLRFDVADRPRVMAGLATALGDQGVSIEQIVQEAVEGRRAGDPPAKPSSGGAATVVMTTQRAREGAVRAALASIAKEPFLAGPPRLLRIVDGAP